MSLRSGRAVWPFWLLVLAAPLGLAWHSRDALGASLLLSVAAGLLTHHIVPGVAPLLARAGQCGRDLNKAGQPMLPESLGLVAGGVYLMGLCVFLPVPFWQALENSESFPFQKLGEYTAALLSISCMLLLGFADDVLNLRWRHKILLPALACIPLLMLYRVALGATSVLVPFTMRLVDVGVLYYAYMMCMAVFCTNSINILAGTNGLEVGQSILIAISATLLNLGELALRPHAAHRLSLFLLLPFLAVSLALWRHNRYPARVFVGDTYCYFAGMTFAVVAILGHYSKTMLLLFVPQLINFALSMPQLVGIVPCPRHRMPVLDRDSGLLQPSTVELGEAEWSRPGTRPILSVLGSLGLCRVSKDRRRVTNLTIINAVLVHGGPLREDLLTRRLLHFQLLCNGLGLALRYQLVRLLPASRE